MKIAKNHDETKPPTANTVAGDDNVNFDPAAAGLERLRAELASVRDDRLRLAAEFDNYRRRTKRERALAADAGKRELLERLVAVADDLDLALASPAVDPAAIAEGLQLIRKRFYAVLEANEVTPFESRGKKFDPALHEAFDVVSGTEHEPQTVHTEVRRGYFWRGNLLRPALVVVAQ